MGAHGCLTEAITAFNTAAKLGGNLTPRLAYQRALAELALCNPAAALKDLNRAIHLNPTMQIANRMRDGVSALQLATEGDFRRAHVRLNSLLHSKQPHDADSSLEGLPSAF